MVLLGGNENDVTGLRNSMSIRDMSPIFVYASCLY